MTESPKRRNLSGIYFRHENEKGEFEDVCFEELPLSEQQHYLDIHSKEWCDSLALELAKTLNSLGEKLDLVRE